MKRRTYEERPCTICGTSFTAPPYAAATTCSVPCTIKLRSRRHPPESVRVFAAHCVEPTRNGCSGWTGPRDESGYAMFPASIRGHERLLYAHIPAAPAMTSGASATRARRIRNGPRRVPGPDVLTLAIRRGAQPQSFATTTPLPAWPGSPA
jgi:hypothetical protein